MKFFLLLLFCAMMTGSGQALASTVQGRATRSADPQQGIGSTRITIFTPTLSAFHETRTNSSGNFSFTDVPDGSYRIGATARNFDYVENDLTVTPSLPDQNFLLSPESHQGSWATIGQTAPEYLDATNSAILLNDGRIMYCHDTQDPVLFDPVTGQNAYPQGSLSMQGCHNTAVMQDGRVIFCGGQDSEDFRDASRKVKRFDPVSAMWDSLQDLNEERWYPGLCRFEDGSFILMGGGQSPNAQRTPTTEIFDLITELFTPAGNMVNPCEYPPSALLLNGDVLATWSPPQLYDRALNTWTATGNFVQPNRGYPDHSDHSLVMLGDRRLLAVGIKRGTVNPHMSEIYDRQTGMWSLTADISVPRERTEVIMMPDERVLAAAGRLTVNRHDIPNNQQYVKLTDIYDPRQNLWRSVAPMAIFREYHATTVLVPDGRIVTTGGTNINFSVPTSYDVEAFSPPYLFRGVRPEIENLSNTLFTWGDQVTFDVFPQTAVTDIVMLGTMSVTHWVESGVNRYAQIDFEQNGSSITAYFPADPLQLPAGSYILFAMVDDIPSPGIIVRVLLSAPGELTIYRAGDNVQLRWRHASGAQTYQIFGSDDPSFVAETLIAETADSTYTAPIPAQSAQFYRVRALY